MLLLPLTHRKLFPSPFGNKQADANSFAEEFDGERIKAPILLMPSSGEDMDVVRLPTFAFQQAVADLQIKKIYEAVEAKNPGKNELKPYPSSAHGWTAARGDVSTRPSYLALPATDDTAQDRGGQEGVHRGIPGHGKLLQQAPLDGDRVRSRKTSKAITYIMHSDLSTNSVRVIGIEFQSREKKGHRASS
jgi:hypothetical protein